MRFEKHGRLGFAAAGIWLLTGSVAMAGSVVRIAYDVDQRNDGYMAFDLSVENATLGTLIDVRADAVGQNLPTLYFGDVASGSSASRPAQLSWDPAGEPPNLVWNVSYVNATGGRSAVVEE